MNTEENVNETNAEEKGRSIKKKSSFFEKAKQSLVKAFDKNDDGELDIKDMSIIADSLGDTAKKAAVAVKDSVKEGSKQLNTKLEQSRREAELKALAPIFHEDLEDISFSMPKLIRITDMDKRHAESELCKGSIGFSSIQKDLRVVNIYRNELEQWGISLYPDKDSEIYYVDPVDRDHYIALDDYFNYLKIARVNELQKLAQDLGAKHFKVTYKEHRKSVSEDDKRIKAFVKGKANGTNEEAAANAEHKQTNSDYSAIEIAAEMECVGHDPVEPKLVYLAKETNIQMLISLRMSHNPMLHQTYTLQLSNTSGIKVKDAVKIDAALASMKLSGDTAITTEAQNEEGRFFEYEIDF